MISPGTHIFKHQQRQEEFSFKIGIITEKLKQYIYCILKTDKTSLLYSHFREHGTTNLGIMGVESSPTWTLHRRRSRKSTV